MSSRKRRRRYPPVVEKRAPGWAERLGKVIGYVVLRLLLWEIEKHIEGPHQ
jgi:hypothetical protein